MDTILLKKQAGCMNPYKWVYTDILGRIQFKNITSLKLEEVIKAFLVNLKQQPNFTSEELV
jgi:hypothetical protein